MDTKTWVIGAIVIALIAWFWIDRKKKGRESDPVTASLEDIQRAVAENGVTTGQTISLRDPNQNR